jgi:hypothetical protein
LHDGDKILRWLDSSPNANDALLGGKLTDSCPQGDTLVGMQDVQWWQFAQSFTAKGGRLHSAKFNLGPYGGCTGDVMAHLYASTGVVGSTAMPIGTPLATSEIKQAQTMGAGWVEFLFTGANAMDMVAGTDYCIAIDARAATGAPIGVYYWTTGTHAGNLSGQLGANPWGAWGGSPDLPFKLYVDSNPIFKENVIGAGGWPVVRLAATGDSFILKNLISGAGDYTLIFVTKPLNVAAPSFVMAGTDLNPYAMYFDGAVTPSAIHSSRSAYQQFRTWGWESTWRVWVAIVRAGNTEFYIDGGGQSGYGQLPAGTTYIGDFNSIGGRSVDDLFPANLDMADILFCGEALLDAVVKNATQTLSNKYGLGLAVGTPMDLLTLPSLKGWWAANTLGSDIISRRWLDRGPFANIAKPTGAPLLVRNALNGHAIVRTRSASKDGFNLATPIPNTAPYTAFVVLKSAGGNGPMSLMSATQHGTGSYWGGLWYGGCSWYSLGLGVGAEATNWHCITNSHVNGALANIYLDGVRGANSGAGGDTNPFITIGYQGGSFGDGDLALILMCDGLLADTDRQNAEKTISAKYGTPAPPAGVVIDLATLPNIRCWWEADTLL